MSCLAATNGNCLYSKTQQLYMTKRKIPTKEHVYTKNFNTQFRPLPEVVAYGTYFVDPQYARDSNWNEHSYDQNRLEYK